MPPEKMIPLVSPPPGGETKGGWSPLWMPLDACASLGVWTGDAGGDDAPGRRNREPTVPWPLPGRIPPPAGGGDAERPEQSSGPPSPPKFLIPNS